jgi:ribulose-5-phosphate 4-epimerase/fuculose-1-phosphate aldolase
MNTEERLVTDLVIANRVLANEGVLDAFGHVSVRHPEDPTRFLLARSRSPELVEAGDILEFGLDGQPTSEADRPLYVERFIHAAIYAARPKIHAAIHAHTEATLPFGLTDVPLVAVIHSASDLGGTVPVWDIRDRFGDTNMLVTTLGQAEDLVEKLGGNDAVLMRGHGFAAGGLSLQTLTRLCVFLARNARVQLSALMLGPFKPLSEGESLARRSFTADSPEIRRAWECWATRAGCGELMAD